MLTTRAADEAALRAYLAGLYRDNRAHRAAFFRAMRDTLTERQYIALCLHFLEGKKQKELAALWGISSSAVSAHIRRAKAHVAVMRAYNLELRPMEAA